MVTRCPSGGYRAERIMQLTDVLRGRETTTLSDLAKRQPVVLCCVISRRLRARGMPITGEAGPGGGVRLDGNRGLAAIHPADQRAFVSPRSTSVLWGPEGAKRSQTCSAAATELRSGFQLGTLAVVYLARPTRSTSAAKRGSERSPSKAGSTLSKAICQSRASSPF